MTTSLAAPEVVGPASTDELRRRTPWLLGLLCLLNGILPSYVVPPGPLKSNGSPAKVIAIGLLFLVALGVVFVRRSGRTPRLRLGLVFLSGYFVAMLAIYGVGISHTDTPVVEATKTREFIILLANFGVATYTMIRIKTARQRYFVLGAAAIGLTFNCVVGLLQHSTLIDLHLLFKPPGFVLTDTNEYLKTGASLEDRFGSTRAVGTTLHAIEFSVLAAVAVPLTLHFARFGRTGWIRLAAIMAAVVALVSIPAGVTRTGVVALAVSLLIYAWAFKVRELFTAALLGGVALGVEFLVSPGTIDAIVRTVTNADEDPSVLARVADYGRVAATFRAHPIFGLGLGGAPPSEYGFLDNQWLQALVQGGIIGVAGMLVLAVGAVFGVAGALRSAADRRQRDLAFAMGAMLMSILASSATFDLFTFQQATLLFFVLYGLVWSNYDVAFPEPKGSG
ncbi:O-antigen ligase family protein [Skermania sp. ID1734]|uniref:O-antigen ligase family protein n=1 Tax=Skermania sp. ID1734 TaxID=2597516 RepID=UPI00117C62DE|nr:O-antigen ligase family protein [Skermania sp. ID1734]TSD94466.1 O-antigen ligase family protein [Skermania sp. ID1734]